MNGYRPIVELMNTNFGIYAMAEISSAGATLRNTPLPPPRTHPTATTLHPLSVSYDTPLA